MERTRCIKTFSFFFFLILKSEWLQKDYHGTTYHATQEFHFWVYTQENLKQGLRHLYTSVHSSLVDNSQKVEATEVSTAR
jgi:hypothetical protein